MTSATGEATTTGVVPTSPVPVVNVAQGPQRSPLRYPGGKTWLVPHIRAWLNALESPQLLIEPFAGGGITSLTAVMEGLVPNCLMVELDQDVADFWGAALYHNHQLIRETTVCSAGTGEVLTLEDSTTKLLAAQTVSRDAFEAALIERLTSLEPLI